MNEEFDTLAQTCEESLSSSNCSEQAVEDASDSITSPTDSSENGIGSMSTLPSDGLSG
jgi:hypothetical protein